MDQDSCQKELQARGCNRCATANDPLKPIVLIEYRTLICECLARIIGGEIGCTVVSFADAESWRLQRDQFQPPLVVLGEVERYQSGERQEMVRRFLESESTPVVVICNPQEMEGMMDAFHRGAKGIIPFDTPIEITVGAIRLALVGGVFIPAAMVLSRSQSLNVKAGSSLDSSPFTARESAILQALCKGKANKVIASDLRLSESTVKVHVHNVMRKLAVTNRTEAVIKMGILALAPAIECRDNYGLDPIVGGPDGVELCLKMGDGA
jgi:DNA-binding NarL/FixJ family response regulator